MKSEQFYDDWKRQRNQIEVGDDFTGKVMHQVRQYEQKKKYSLSGTQRLIATITAHPLVQVAMVAVGAIVGFIRLAIMLHIMLYT